MRLPTARLAKYALAGVAIGAVAAVASPAVGLFGRSGHQPTLAGKAQQLVALTAPNGKAVSLWQAPTTDGGVCVLLHVGQASAAAPPGLADSGSDCISGPSRLPQPAPFQTALNWGRPGDGSAYTLIVYGHVSAASRISRVDLSSGSGTQALPFAKGYFLTELPDVPSAGALPAQDAPYVLKGYDNDGSLIASLDLAHVVAMSSPSQSSAK